MPLACVAFSILKKSLKISIRILDPPMPPPTPAQCESPVKEESGLQSGVRKEDSGIRASWISSQPPAFIPT